MGEQRPVTNISSPPVQAYQRRKKRSIMLISILLLLIISGGFAYIQRDALREALRAMLGRANVPGGETGTTPLRLPPGYRADIFAEGLSDPRFLTFTPDGTLLVAERGTDSVIALSYPQGERRVIVDGLDDPSSVAFQNGWLYVGETSQVSRFALNSQYQVTKQEVVVPDLPVGGHSTRTVLIGPDNKLYVSIGSSCNVCAEDDPHRAAVWMYDLDGSNGRLYAKGLRNAVGMEINPWNQQIWVTNNGRDHLGDDSPPETLYALLNNGDYGWPRCHSGDIIDPEFGHEGACNGVIQPLAKMQAHSAPLGLAFYNNGPFPEENHGVFVAFHGSWNRSVATGYKVVFIPLDDNGNIAGEPRDFATGWLQDDENRRGRPAGITVSPDGALLVTDDTAGLIYRISYSG